MSDYQFGGDYYRDDRMYVMRITSDFSKSNDGSITASMKAEGRVQPDVPVVLITYRNVASLPAVRVDDFPSRREAIEYIKNVEPTCPRVSGNGQAPKPTPSWDEHLEWLHSLGLRSAAEGDGSIPDWGARDDNPRETLMRNPKS